ncbi:MAG: DUF4363 family protein [Clostridiales bacterium]|nr:DUF4363 family protein [Clostridiales bacterium]
MKRFICALIIFCLLTVFSVYCAEKNKNALESAKERIGEISSLCEKDENEAALEEAKKLEENWKKEHIILKITLEQSSFGDVEKAVISIPHLIESGKTDKAKELCVDAIFEIEYLLEGEKLSFENIF